MKHLLTPLLSLLLLSPALNAQGNWEQIMIPIPVFADLQDAHEGYLVGQVVYPIDSVSQRFWGISADGETWRPLAPDSIDVKSAVFSKSGALLLVDAERKLWRSEDHGRSWSELVVQKAPPKTESDTLKNSERPVWGDIEDFAIDPFLDGGRPVQVRTEVVDRAETYPPPGYAFRRPEATFHRYGDTLIVSTSSLTALSFDNGRNWEEAFASESTLSDKRVVERVKGRLRVASNLVNPDYWAIGDIKTGPHGSTFQLVEGTPITESTPHTIGTVAMTYTDRIYNRSTINWSVAPSGRVFLYDRSSRSLSWHDRSGESTTLPTSYLNSDRTGGFNSLVAVSDTLLYGTTYSQLHRIVVGRDSVHATMILRPHYGPTNILAIEKEGNEELRIKTPFHWSVFRLMDESVRVIPPPGHRPSTSRSTKWHGGSFVTSSGFELFGLENSSCWPECSSIGGRRLLKGAELVWQVYRKTLDRTEWVACDLPYFAERPIVRSLGEHLYVYSQAAPPSSGGGEEVAVAYSSDAGTTWVELREKSGTIESSKREVLSTHSTLVRGESGLEIYTVSSEGTSTEPLPCNETTTSWNLDQVFMFRDSANRPWMVLPCGIYRSGGDSSWEFIAPGLEQRLHPHLSPVHVMGEEVFAVTEYGLWRWRE